MSTTYGATGLGQTAAYYPARLLQGRLPFWVDAVEKVENAAERE